MVWAICEAMRAHIVSAADGAGVASTYIAGSLEASEFKEPYATITGKLPETSFQ